MPHRLLPLLLLLAPSLAFASGQDDGFTSGLLALAGVLVAARVAGHLASRLGQPAVLGELVAGLALGNLHLLWGPDLGVAASSPLLTLLSELGVVLLLFDVGLGSTLAQMLRVGPSAVLVAILGVVAPMILGVGVGHLLLPQSSVYVHLFLGATLTATSVGITARVLQDLGRSSSPEARVILGAAVVDDVLGLVILAAVSGVITAVDAGGSSGWSPILWIVAKTTAFLVGAVALGVALTPWLYRHAARLDGDGVLLCVSLAFCFLLAGLAGAVGLAPIVGAFAAGLILDAAHYQSFVDRGDHPLEELVRPVVHFLAPVFFVTMGMKVDLEALADPGALVLALALTAAAVLGKQACMLGVLDRGIRRLPVGLGMIPRGEVGLIFANIGLTLTLGGQPIIDPTLFGAVVIMVILTTLLTPTLLAWGLGRGEAGATP